jgi:hypothetical protein
MDLALPLLVPLAPLEQQPVEQQQRQGWHSHHFPLVALMKGKKLPEVGLQVIRKMGKLRAAKRQKASGGDGEGPDTATDFGRPLKSLMVLRTSPVSVYRRLTND